MFAYGSYVKYKSSHISILYIKLYFGEVKG